MNGSYVQDEPEDHEEVVMTYEQYKRYVAGAHSFAFDELCVELARQRKIADEAKAATNTAAQLLLERDQKISEMRISLGKAEEEVIRLQKHIGNMCSHLDGGCSECPIYDDCNEPGKEEEGEEYR